MQKAPRSVHIIALGAFISTLTMCQSEELPVVARGRYVEIATIRNDVVCGGTVSFMDDYLDSVFALLDAMPPNRIFVRYEWRAASNGPDEPVVNHASRHGDMSIIRADRLLHEHELAHAAHGQAWPSSRRFLQEGLAVLLDSSGALEQVAWPSGLPLDPLLEDDVLDDGGYHRAWFVVSQVVLDHGFEGLYELWHAVPPDASAEDVRRAYEDLFHRPIDELLEPREYYEGGPVGERLPCYYVLCGEPQPWDGGIWQAEGPFDCADDLNALGPIGGGGTGPVARYHVVELEPATLYRFTTSGGAGTYLRACGLQCLPLGVPALPFVPDASTSRSDLPGGRYRVEILADSDDLPLDTAGAFEIELLE